MEAIILTFSCSVVMVNMTIAATLVHMIIKCDNFKWLVVIIINSLTTCYIGPF